MPGQIQEGIYFAPGARPGRFFSIIFLRASKDVELDQIGKTISGLWGVYQGLIVGTLRDLPGHPVDPAELTILLGYGPKAFGLPGAKLQLPSDFQSSSWFRSPLPTGGGPLLIGSGLRYASDVTDNVATEEFAFQFIANSQLAVHRCVVETWKYLLDMCDPTTSQSPVMITGFFSGFQRDDGRSWIDFHDGVSNLRSTDRLGAIGIKPSGTASEAWTENGTYLAFLRIAVDLTAWRKLTRAQQEAMVGRDKLTGCPLVNGGASAGCPFAGTREIIEPGNEGFRDAPASVGPLALSHIHRANHRLGPPEDRNSLRIFRQGYEFLEPLSGPPGFRAGLNFVSFQDSPSRLLRILTQPGWLGQTNFAGDPAAPLPGSEHLLVVRSGGTYLVPPAIPSEAFPGASLFPN